MRRRRRRGRERLRRVLSFPFDPPITRTYAIRAKRYETVDHRSSRGRRICFCQGSAPRTVTTRPFKPSTEETRNEEEKIQGREREKWSERDSKRHVERRGDDLIRWLFARKRNEETPLRGSRRQRRFPRREKFLRPGGKEAEAAGRTCDRKGGHGLFVCDALGESRRQDLDTATSFSGCVGRIRLARPCAS